MSPSGTIWKHNYQYEHNTHSTQAQMVFNYYVFPGNRYFYSGNTYIELVNG